MINNKGIIRNKLKINAAINNSKIFIKIQKEYGTFSKYIWSFTNNKIIIHDFFTIGNIIFNSFLLSVIPGHIIFTLK